MELAKGDGASERHEGGEIRILRPAVSAVPYIWDKLDRADTHILELELALERFNSEPSRTVTNPDEATLASFRKLHRGQGVAPTFSILAGEAIHHLRSSLDHLVASLILYEDQTASVSHSAFPILVDPTRANLKLYEKRIKGISRPNVREFLDKLQPYKRGPKAWSHWLVMLDQKWNHDKHRALLDLVSKTEVTHTVRYHECEIQRTGPDDDAVPSQETFAELAEPTLAGSRFQAYVGFRELNSEMATSHGVCYLLRQLSAGVRGVVLEAEQFFI